MKITKPISLPYRVNILKHEEIEGYAIEVLKLDLPADREFLHLAEEALRAPLPRGWNVYEYREDLLSNEEGIIVFKNEETGEFTETNPWDVYYYEKIQKLKMIKTAYSHGEPITESEKDLLESSVMIKKLNNSSLSYKEEQMSNNSSLVASNLRKKSKVENIDNSNITEESFIYDSFDEISLKTDRMKNETEDFPKKKVTDDYSDYNLKPKNEKKGQVNQGKFNAKKNLFGDEKQKPQNQGIVSSGQLLNNEKSKNWTEEHQNNNSNLQKIASIESRKYELISFIKSAQKQMINEMLDKINRTIKINPEGSLEGCSNPSSSSGGYEHIANQAASSCSKYWERKFSAKRQEIIEQQRMNRELDQKIKSLKQRVESPV